ncbi:MAG: hypothetical protein Q7S21_05275 [archaeon]|nr:hypothetical protein [archaeon]
MEKRKAPKEIVPIINNGIKYNAPHFAVLNKGMLHNGGYVEAINIKTNKRIWLKEVYKPKLNSNFEDDIQDVFITSLNLKNKKLIIINENNEKFEVEL